MFNVLLFCFPFSNFLKLNIWLIITIFLELISESHGLGNVAAPQSGGAAVDTSVSFAAHQLGEQTVAVWVMSLCHTLWVMCRHLT